MRILLIFVFFLVSPALAQEDDQPTFFEYLKSLGKSDCEAFIDNGDALVNASNKAANKREWDDAFYFDEQAFHAYLKAFGYCDDEPDNRDKARSRLNDNQHHGNVLSCMFHITESQSIYQRSTLALDELGSVGTSLKYAKRSMSSLDDAETYCAFDNKRLKEISNMKTLVQETIDILQKHVDEHGDDSIDSIIEND